MNQIAKIAAITKHGRAAVITGGSKMSFKGIKHGR